MLGVIGYTFAKGSRNYYENLINFTVYVRNHRLVNVVNLCEFLS